MTPAGAKPQFTRRRFFSFLLKISVCSIANRSASEMQGVIRSSEVEKLLSRYTTVHAMHVVLVTRGLAYGTALRYTKRRGSYVSNPLFLALGQ